MLTRIYIDNFRCFVNFEYKPASRQLIMGANGAGKSSLPDVIRMLRRFAVAGIDPALLRILDQRTRWMSQTQQTFEIEAILDREKYVYKLVVDPWGDPPRTRVMSETVQLDERPIFEFKTGKVSLYDDRFELKVAYPFDWHRSALATIIPGPENTKLIRFRQWFAGVLVFRMNPFTMRARAEREQNAPRVSLANFAEWYRHLVQAYPKENSLFFESLRSALDGFGGLELRGAGENVRLLFCEFARAGGPPVKFSFGELSDGQRCLICLYAVLHFVLSKGNMVMLDEPDNFISLREIQPWLNAVSDVIDESHGQVLLISHHPEIMNQWAPDYGVQFVRDGLGPVRVKQFSGEGYKSLVPSEIVARGWENE
jgi:energy-coupling factor transporter ATP-binding protein EcfA2